MSKAEKRKRQEDIQKNIAFMYGRNKEEAKHDPDKRTFMPSAKKTFNIDSINKFEGDFACLDPAFPCEVYLADNFFPSDVIVFPTYEHAFQSTRTSDKLKREEIKNAVTVREAKKIAAKASYPEWKEQCLNFAKNILRDKFIRNKQLKTNLMKTENKTLNYIPEYSDLYWGLDSNGKGQNQYGKLLESIRNEISRGDDLEKWILSYCNLMDPENVEFNIRVKKDGVSLEEEKKISNKSFFYIGKAEDSDLVASHLSVSRDHAIVFLTSAWELYIIDLNTSNGTKIDKGSNLKPFIPYPISSNNSINFGASSRDYYFGFDPNFASKRKELLYSKVVNTNSESSSSNSKERSSENTIFVGNLPDDVNQSLLSEFFSTCGSIKNIFIPTDKTTKKSRGIAFVTFDTPSGFLQGMTKDKDLFMEREIRVNRSK